MAGGVLYRPVLNCTVDPCSSRTIWQVDAHDAAGTVGCSGAPKVCNSLWTASFPFRVGEVLVVGDVVYAVGVSADFNGPSPEVWAFRAS